jgi:hypothetical protein
MSALENTLLSLAQDIKRNDGKLPAKEGNEVSYVQFCNGSPGAIPMFIAGAHLFPKHASDFLDVASIIGEVIF